MKLQQVYQWQWTECRWQAWEMGHYPEGPGQTPEACLGVNHMKIRKVKCRALHLATVTPGTHTAWGKNRSRAALPRRTCGCWWRSDWTWPRHGHSEPNVSWSASRAVWGGDFPLYSALVRSHTEKKRVLGDLTAAFQYLQWVYKKDRDRFFSRVCCNIEVTTRTRHNGFPLKEGRAALY